MLWQGTGKVTVALAGTPVLLSAVIIPVKINSLIITYDAADGSATVYVKDRVGNVMASMAGATSQPLVFNAPGGNQIDPRDFQIDSGTNGKGPFVAYATD